MEATAAESRPQYTCLIRLPFPRGDFVDPPPVDWDASKDKALWKIISKAANSKDLDWPELSNKFQVSLPFLLQQAAWLYERHFAQMRAQMKKLGASNTSSPAPPPESSGPAQRPASRGSRAPSALSIHSKDSPQLPSGSIVSPGARPNAPPMSRTPSTRTVTQSRLSQQPQSPRDAGPSSRTFRPSFSASQRKAPYLDADNTALSPPLASPSSDSALSSDEDDAPVHRSVAKSQLFRRPPDLRTISSDGDNEDDDEDESSSGGFLPFASRNENEGDAPTLDPAATIRTSPAMKADQTPKIGTSTTPDKGKKLDATAPESARMARAASTPGRPGVAVTKSGEKVSVGGRLVPVGQLSPRHRAELARLSSSGRQSSKEGSEGTPSMGSSFSDLDDASVTQSALEDALLSNMQHGGSMASRMSTFSHALRSKYLPQ